MNKKTICLIVSLVVMTAGLVIAWLCKMPVAKISAFGVAMAGAGVAGAELFASKGEAIKGWVAWLGIGLMGLGCFAVGLFAVMSVEQVGTFIGLIFGILAFIAGLITTFIGLKKAKA